MKWLLDTHAVIWFAADPGRSRREVVDAIEAPGAQVSISAAFPLHNRDSLDRMLLAQAR
ncbi:hypothetical protein [Sorangium sp. So ce394]|uniref:hypothetical protein n=1 Tax=Sorangium sp. So ce394 TaxID=3133310 RepID=UPI003F5AE63B